MDGGDYRFFSTEYDLADMVNAGQGRARPMRLNGLTLTNAPNNKGGRPITNRAQSAVTPVAPPQPPRAHFAQPETVLAAVVAGRILQNRTAQRGDRVSYDEAWEAAKCAAATLYKVAGGATPAELDAIERCACAEYMKAALETGRVENREDAAARSFFMVINGLRQARQDLGWVGRWDAARQSNPVEFWSHILSGCDSDLARSVATDGGRGGTKAALAPAGPGETME